MRSTSWGRILARESLLLKFVFHDQIVAEKLQREDQLDTRSIIRPHEHAPAMHQSRLRLHKTGLHRQPSLLSRRESLRRLSSPTSGPSETPSG